LDGDGDGKVTRAELAEYYRLFNGDAFHYQIRTGATANPDALNDALFTRLDLNKDGKLSREELAAAPETLAKLDLDDDEIISAQELARSLFPVNPNAQFQLAPMARGPAQESPFFIVVPGDPPGGLTQKLLARYGPALKQARDKKLTRKDIGLDQ